MSKSISGVTIKRDILSRCSFVWPKNAIRLSVSFIGELLFLMLSLVVLYWTIWVMADYQEYLNSPVTTVVEPSKKEIAKAHRFHGTSWSWQEGEDFYFKDKQNRTCRLFVYKEGQKCEK